MFVDLHIHSYFSDGAQTPEQAALACRDSGVGLAALCDAAAARFGDTTYLLPIACCAFPLTLLFARLLHKEKIPASALLGLVFAVAGMFALLLEL